MPNKKLKIYVHEPNFNVACSNSVFIFKLPEIRRSSFAATIQNEEQLCIRF